MEAAVKTTEGWLKFEVSTLEIARLVASARGFMCDLEPGAPGAVKLTATDGESTIITNGSTVYDAAEKLIGKLMVI